MCGAALHSPNGEWLSESAVKIYCAHPLLTLSVVRGETEMRKRDELKRRWRQRGGGLSEPDIEE